MNLEFEVSIMPDPDSDTVVLIHWDGLHGNDTIIYLDKDGAHVKRSDDGNGETFRTEDLRSALIETIKRRDDEEKEYREMLQPETVRTGIGVVATVSDAPDLVI